MAWMQGHPRPRAKGTSCPEQLREIGFCCTLASHRPEKDTVLAYWAVAGTLRSHSEHNHSLVRRLHSPAPTAAVAPKSAQLRAENRVIKVPHPVVESERLGGPRRSSAHDPHVPHTCSSCDGYRTPAVKGSARACLPQ